MKKTEKRMGRVIIRMDMVTIIGVGSTLQFDPLTSLKSTMRIYWPDQCLQRGSCHFWIVRSH